MTYGTISVVCGVCRSPGWERDENTAWRFRDAKNVRNDKRAPVFWPERTGSLGKQRALSKESGLWFVSRIPSDVPSLRVTSPSVKVIHGKSELVGSKSHCVKHPAVICQFITFRKRTRPNTRTHLSCHLTKHTFIQSRKTGASFRKSLIKVRKRQHINNYALFVYHSTGCSEQAVTIATLTRCNRSRLL